MRTFSITLNRRDHSIRVQRTTHNIRLAKVNRKVSLKHTGLRGRDGKTGTIEVGTTSTLPAGSPAQVTNIGTDTAAVLEFEIPKGDKGDTGYSTFVRVHHGDDNSIARPDALYVEWVGSVAPLNATVEDTWIAYVPQ